MTRTKGEVRNLGGAAVHLDEPGRAALFLFTLCVKNEVETIETGQRETRGEYLGGSVHRCVLDAPHDGGGSALIAGCEHLHANTGQNLALPAEDGAVDIYTGDRALHADRGPLS